MTFYKLNLWVGMGNKFLMDVSCCWLVTDTQILWEFVNNGDARLFPML